MSMTAVRNAALAVMLAGTAMLAAGTAYAGNQSSNTSSNSSSNNGVVRERVIDRYCEDGYCERRIQRRIYRDDRPSRWRHKYDRSPYRYHRHEQRFYR